MQRIRTLQRLHIQIGDIALPIRQLHAHLELLVEHEVVLPEAARAVVHAQHALLHLHLVGRAAPGHGVVFALLAAGPRDGDAAFAEGEAGAWACGLADAVLVRGGGGAAGRGATG
jgi:hypothetical protein